MIDRPHVVLSLATSFLLLAACGHDDRRAGGDAGPVDASTSDAHVPGGDAGGSDAGEVPTDAGGMDASAVPDSGAEDGGAADAAVEDAGEAPADAGGTDAGGSSDAGGEVDGGSSTADAGADAEPVAMACPEVDVGSTVADMVASGTTRGATDSTSPSCVSSSSAPDVGHLFTAPSAARYRFDTRGSALDTVLYVLDGTDCGGTELACNDDIGGGTLASSLTVDLEAGQEVVVVVDAWHRGAGSYVLNVEAVEASCDDGVDDDSDGRVDCMDSDCDSDSACIETLCSDGVDDEGDGDTDCMDADCAADVACCTDFDLGSAVGAAVATGTTSGDSHYDPCSAGGSGPEVLYLWTAPADGTYTFDTCDSGYDTTLWVNESDGTCSGRNLACNDDSCGTRSSVSVTVTAGQRLVIGVDGYGPTSSGSYVLDITGP